MGTFSFWSLKPEKHKCLQSLAGDIKKYRPGTLLVVQGLRLHSQCPGPGSIPDQGTRNAVTKTGHSGGGGRRGEGIKAKCQVYMDSTQFHKEIYTL